MSRTSLELDKTSYTNKDFNQVYPELLELAKQLSYKWDPTTSNESDPGVVLIKEMALAIDKINYNTDKSALEQFPTTVQQENIARELFPLLGYYPKSYKSCLETLSIVFTGESQEGSLQIPRFTMVKNEDEDLVYTMTQSVSLEMTQSNSTTCPIIEGVVEELEVNDTVTITSDMLDSNNRIFFSQYNVAQNGVFVYNESNLNNRWNQVDNIALEDSGTYCYEFGIDSITNEPYLEFPSWINSIIDSGLNIWYCVSQGSQGRAPLGELSTFYSASVTCETSTGEEITLTSENISLANIQVDDYEYGKDPETISEMYKNYKKTCGTFDTLVTRRDYENGIYLTGDVSNCKVCDRTNDIQSSYMIQKEDNRKLMYDEDNMNPYNLKVYAFQYVSPIESKLAYNTTFTMPTVNSIEEPPISDALVDINDLQLMNIEFKDLNDEQMCLFTNLYDVKGQIYTNTNLDASQKQEVTTNVQKALFKAYNSQEIEFGEEINRQELINTIKAADKRIITLYIDDFNYQTNVQFYEDDVLKSIPISDECAIKITNLYWDTANMSATFTVDGKTKSSKDYSIGQLFINNEDSETYALNNIYYINTSNQFDLYSQKRQTFREEIIAKSILAGITPYYDFDKNNFQYYMGEGPCENSTSTKTLDDIVQTSNITTNKTYTIDLSSSGAASRIFTVNPNNVIQFTRPSLYDSVQFGTYTKYEFVSGFRSKVIAGEDYKLQQGEYITFVWSSSDSQEMYNTRTYGAGTIIQPSFGLVPTAYDVANTNITNEAHTHELPYDMTIQPAAADGLSSLSASDYISIREKNEFTLTNKNLVYIISTETVNDENYRMVIDGSYTLKNQEYLVYTTSDKTKLSYVGPGTMITLSGSVTWICPIISQTRISLLGIKAFKDSDWIIPDRTVTLTEQEFINLTEGTSVQINPRMPITNGKLVFTSDPDELNITGETTRSVTVSTQLVKLRTGMTQHIDEFITDVYKDNILTTAHYDSVQLNAVVTSNGNQWRFVDKQTVTIGLTDNYFGYDVTVFGTESELLQVRTTYATQFEFGLDSWKLYKWDTTEEKYVDATSSIISGLPESPVAGNLYQLTSSTSEYGINTIVYAYSAQTGSVMLRVIVPGKDSVYYYFDFHGQRDLTSSQDTTQYEYVFTAGNQVVLSYFKTGSGQSLDMSVLQSITYTRSTGEEGTIVPGTSSLSWKIAGYLNLKCSTEEPQELADGEYIKIPSSGDIYQNNSTTGTRILIESDLELDEQGGTNVDIQQLDNTSGEYLIPTLRIYTLGSGTTKTSQLESILIVGTGTSSTKITTEPTRLNAGTYVMKLVNKLEDIQKTGTVIQFSYSTTPTVETSWTPLTYGNNQSNVAAEGTYFLTMTTASDLTNVYFRCVITGKETTTQTEKLTATYLNKVTENTVLTSSIKNKIKELDEDNIFDYLHVIDEDVLIENPLSATSFFNENHPYHEFVICQLNNYNMKIMR